MKRRFLFLIKTDLVHRNLVDRQYLRQVQNLVENADILDRQRLMQHDMSKGKSGNLRHTRQCLACALHNDAVLVKIHPAVHVGNVTNHTLLVDDHLHVRRAAEHQLVILHERN